MNLGTASASNNTDSLEIESIVTDTRSPFRPLIIAFLITTVLALFIASRLSKQGQWLPPIPNEIANGAWTATDVPLDAKTMAELGTPNVYGRRYTNPFDEHIDAHVIAAASIESYHEPAFCMAGYGYTQTAQKIMYPFGSGKPVRAIILRNNISGQRILLYFWVQDQHGETSTHGSFRAYQDYAPRLNLGLKVAVDGGQSCIIRAYTMIHPADPDGRQARRNLDSVAQALYSALKQGGAYKTPEAAS